MGYEKGKVMTIDTRCGDDSSIFDPAEVKQRGPATIAEWVAQTKETGILEFEQLLAIASSQAPLISLATKLLEFVREYDPETLVIKRGDGKRNHPSPLCQCSECQAKFDEMGKGETQPA